MNAFARCDGCNELLYYSSSGALICRNPECPQSAAYTNKVAAKPYLEKLEEIMMLPASALTVGDLQMILLKEATLTMAKMEELLRHGGGTSPANPASSHDAVNHPGHYNSHPSGVECITIVECMAFNIGNAVKYLWRAGLKGEHTFAATVEDLHKAAWYVNREIERITKEEGKNETI